MTFAPLTLMHARIRRYGADSDSAMFTELLYAGELILKITTGAFVAAIEDDRENRRYRLLHDLVRADGVGEWARTLDEVLTGPTSQQLTASLIDARRTFTERLGKGTWQYDAVRVLHEVLAGVHADTQPITSKVALRAWFQTFAELRNKTRGHGALTPATCAKLVPKLEQTIQLIWANNPIFEMPWAYLHRNLSGKYNVVEVGGDQTVFGKLKSAAAANGENYPDGLYFWAGGYTADGGQGNCTAASATQSRSNPVSGPGLPKTGIFRDVAGDFRRSTPESAQIWSLETDSQLAKAHHWRAFLRL